MSTLIRSDGVQFVIRAYRELIKVSKKRALAQRVRHIAQQQGDYVRLFKRSNNEFEAVFSAEPGYLLGESIKQQFPQESNIIYIETLANNRTEALLVIIHNDSVFSDTVIPISQISEELLPLKTLKTTFLVVLSCSTPDRQKNEIKAILGDTQHLISHIDYREKGLFQQLPTFDTARLQPLIIALKAERLQSREPIRIVSGLLIVLSIAASTLMLKNPSQPKPTLKLTHPKPFATYRASLKSPEPTQQIDTFLATLSKIYKFAGWQAVTLLQDNAHSWVSLVRTDGSLQTLQKTADENNFSVNLEPDGVSLAQELHFKARENIPKLHPVQSTTEQIIDRINHDFIEVHTSLDRKVTHNLSKEVLITVKFSDLAPKELGLLKPILQDLPVVIRSIEFSMTPDSLISGSVALSIWGN